MDVGYGGVVVEWLKTVFSLSLSHAEQNLDNYHSPTDYLGYLNSSTKLKHIDKFDKTGVAKTVY